MSAPSHLRNDPTAMYDRPPAPKDVGEIVQSMHAEGIVPATGIDRRSQPRYTMTAIADVQPLNAQGQPCGEPVKAVTVDVSATGIGLLAEIPLQARFLCVVWQREGKTTTPAVYEVISCVPYEFVYRIGARPVRPLPATERKIG